MSRRKNRTNAPNLPQETLERARRQAAIERGEAPVTPKPEPEPPVAEARPKPTIDKTGANPYRTVSASQRRAQTEARSTTRRTRGTTVVGARERKAELDQETVSDLLENPTIFVSEEELKRDYGYVLADLRSMFGLAAGLIVALIVLAQVLPR